jgi:vitamin B12 transporter
VLLGGDWAADDLRANATLRLDDSSQYGTRTTASGSVGYRLAPQWRAVLSAGTSFKAPTFSDLYYPYANPTLRPERGQNIEFGFRWSVAESNASLTVYQNNVRDLIQFECDANFNCAPQNVAKAQLRA